MVSSSNQSVPYKLIGTQIPGVGYVDRTSVRAIVLNATTRKIALIHASKEDYYKLPGGGIENSETHVETLSRELLEEIGCKIDSNSLALIGRSEEYRLGNQHQISFCYATVLKEDTGSVALTEEESDDGFLTVWVGIDEALELMDHDDKERWSEFARSVTGRDRFFLKMYKARS